MKIATWQRSLLRNRTAPTSRPHSAPPRRRSFAALLALTSVCVLTPTAARAVSGTDIITTIAEPLFPGYVAADSTGAIYFTAVNPVVGKLTPGGPAGASTPTYDIEKIADIGDAQGITIAEDGSLYVVAGNQVLKVTPSGAVTTVAGTGECGDPHVVGVAGVILGDGGPATQAQLCGPTDLTVTSDGSLYIADFYNNRVRKVSPAGEITTVAGTGVAGFSGDGDSATAAELNAPTAVAVAFTTLYIADAGNHRIRKVSPTGTITTVVGTGVAGSTGDGGPPTEAEINVPTGLAFDRVGDLYIVDHQDNRVRKVSHMLNGRDLPAGSPTITTAVGTGAIFPSDSDGDGGPASEAGLYRPLGVAVTTNGSLVIADFWHNWIRLVRNEPPEAIFTMAEPSSPQVPYPVSFDASASTDPNDAIVLYRWDFGDNSRGPAWGQQVNHTYTHQGKFSVTLTVTDASGATGTKSAWIYTGGAIPFPGGHPCIPMLLSC